MKSKARHALFFLFPAALSAICLSAAKSFLSEQTAPSNALPSRSRVQKDPGSTRLGIQGTAFTLNGKPTFLLGFSYYGALGASKETWKTDLDAMQKQGFNWLRVWANWEAFDNDVSAVDGEGHPREPYLKMLQALLKECDRRGLVVDVTLTRGKDGKGKPRLQTYEAHQRAVETLLQALKPYRNWYLDLANERNIRDSRYAPMADLKRLRTFVKRLQPERLVTASHGGDISQEDLFAYLKEARLDFISPHLPRQAGAAEQTEAKTREMLGWMRESKRIVPVHFQEPFRRGYSDWQPRSEDFAADLLGARSGGAAGWCFHNGGTRTAEDGNPRRSFDLRDGPLFPQLDFEERKFVAYLPDLLQIDTQIP